jgi:hypothetical protein
VQYYVYYNLIMIAYSIIVGFNVRLKSWNWCTKRKSYF